MYELRVLAGNQEWIFNYDGFWLTVTQITISGGLKISTWIIKLLGNKSIQHNVQNWKLDYSQVQKFLLHEIRFFFQIPKVALAKERSNAYWKGNLIIRVHICNWMYNKTGENSHCHFGHVCKQDELLNYIC